MGLIFVMNILVSIIWLVSLIISLGKIEWVGIMKSKGMRVCNPLDCGLALLTDTSSSGFWLDCSRLLASFLVFCSAFSAPPLTTDTLGTAAHLWYPSVRAPSGAQVHLPRQPLHLPPRCLHLLGEPAGATQPCVPLGISGLSPALLPFALLAPDYILDLLPKPFTQSMTSSFSLRKNTQ